LAQLVERDRSPGEAVAGRHGEHDFVAEERLEDDAAVAPGRADDPELELALGHALDDALGVRDGQRDRHAWMLTLELAEQHRHNRAAGSGRRADGERAAGRARLPLVELLDQLLLELQHPLRPAVEREPSLRRLDTAARAVEQLPSEPLLERAHLKAHRWLRDAEPLSRVREALQLDDGAERSQLTRVHKQTLSAEVTLSARFRHTSARISPIRSRLGGGLGVPHKRGIRNRVAAGAQRS